MNAFEIIVIVLLLDIALSLRRRLHGGTTYGVTWTWLWPLDWFHLIRDSWRRR